MDKITVEPFDNKGLNPAIVCVRCPSCHHEMPMSDVNTLTALDHEAGFSCRCGLRLHVAAVAAPVADVIAFSDADEPAKGKPSKSSK